MKKAIYQISAGGTNITGELAKYLISLTVSDKVGTHSDSANITLDDKDGQIVLPPPAAPISIMLGWQGGAIAEVFRGTLDEPRASGSRGGRIIKLTAKGLDTSSKAKEPQLRHFDDMSIQDALSEAGQFAGISEVKVDPDLAQIVRPYLNMHDESFINFGERIAREVGGNFKVVGTRAVLTLKNGGQNAGGVSLATVRAVWGDNLHKYDITPRLGRPALKSVKARYYDADQAEWLETEKETGLEDQEAVGAHRFSKADESEADEQAGSDAATSKRDAGEGSVIIEGDVTAQPEGRCLVTGTRPGCDGLYRIEVVSHKYSRGSGFLTGLSLRQPDDGAGTDSR